MAAVVDRHAHAQLSTAEVAERDAFAYWREMICATFVRLAVEAMEQQRMLEFMRLPLADPSLDADTAARACHVSRRTLYRILGEEGFAARLRRMRLEHARQLLLADRSRPIASAAACGFGSESGQRLDPVIVLLTPRVGLFRAMPGS